MIFGKETLIEQRRQEDNSANHASPEKEVINHHKQASRRLEYRGQHWVFHLVLRVVRVGERNTRNGTVLGEILFGWFDIFFPSLTLDLELYH